MTTALSAESDSAKDAPYACAICKRTDVRLYRSYGLCLDETDLRCNAHVPIDEESIAALPGYHRASKTSGWWVPLIEDGKGTVWGYTSSPEPDIARWYEKRDAAPSPEWRDGGFHDAPALLLPNKAWGIYDDARLAALGAPLPGWRTIQPEIAEGAHAVALKQRELTLAWVERRLRSIPPEELRQAAYAAAAPIVEKGLADRTPYDVDTAIAEAMRALLLAAIGLAAPEKTP